MLRLKLIIGLLLVAQLLRAQPRQVQSFSIADGLAQSQVYALLTDQRGYVWAGTQGGGLSRFDGKEFVTYTEYDGLPGNYINALWEDSKGVLWIGTNRGLCRYQGRFFEAELTAWGSIVAISGHADREQLWALTDQALFRKMENCWEEIPLPEGKQVFSLKVQADRTVIGTSQGAWSWSGDTWQLLAVESPRQPTIWQLSGNQRSLLWACSPDAGVFRLSRDSLLSLRTPGRVLTGVFQASTGDFWLTTQTEGVFVKAASATEWIRLSERDGLGSNNVRTITEDAWGNIWLGTSGGGLSRVQRAPFRSFDQTQGLPGRQVYAVAGSDSLGLVFSVGSRGLMQRTNGLLRPIELDSLLGNVKIKALTVDEKGRIWVGTEGEGIIVSTARGWRRIRDCGGHILHFWSEDSTSIWVSAAYRGLSNVSLREDSLGLQWDVAYFSEEDRLPRGRIETLHKDQRGRLVLGYRNNGLACWRPDSLYWHFRSWHGLPTRGVRAIREDTLGYLWLATAAGLGQLPLYDSLPDLRVFTRADGLQSSNIYCLEVDQQQGVWAGTERGVEQLEFNAERQLRQVTTYRAEEGFTGIETCTDAAFRDHEGNLWFGTMDGLMLHENVRYNASDAPPPRLRFGDVRVVFQSIYDHPDRQVLNGWGKAIDTLQLPHNQNHLGFTLVAIDQARPNDVAYQWMLEGWEDQWNPPSKQEISTYANLPPGEYTFRARSVGEGDRVSEPISLLIQITPPIWQTPWFRTLVIVGLSLLVLLIIGLIFRRWRRRQQEVEEQLRLHNKLLELEQKALQLQMNPHFIANALQGIQYQVRQGAYNMADQYLYKFGALMRSTLYHSRTNRIALSDEIENLQHYLDLEQFRLDHRFRYDIQYSDALETDLIHIPPMLLQPFLENAIHHGLAGKERDGLITVHLAENEANEIVVTIQDNGSGLQQLKADEAKAHQSTALKVIQERLTLLHEKDHSDTPAFALEEVVEAHEVKGVKVRIHIPILDGD